MIAVLDLYSRLGWWYLATAAALLVESYIYWRMMRGWPPEARIFAFGLGCATIGLCAALWATGATVVADAATHDLLQFGFLLAGGLGTAPAFAHLTVQDRWPVWAMRRARKGRSGGPTT